MISQLKAFQNMHSGCITTHDHITKKVVNSILKGTFLQKMNVNLKDICVSLENKEPTSQEKLEERTKLRQFNTYLNNFIQLTL